MMDILEEISAALQKGRDKLAAELVGKALEQSVSAQEILDQGLMRGMDIVGDKFKNNKMFLPEVMMAAKAMNKGTEVLKPCLAAGGLSGLGKAAIGTVKGDRHDIGKNLVKMMIEGKGIETVDLGVDVSAEKFVGACKDKGVRIICCSALLTTTMKEMKRVVELFEKEGLRSQVAIFVGGAPVTEVFRESIGADYYAPDAASAAEMVREVALRHRAESQADA
jgi:methanogenic corrinoid protein MtbC1